MEVAVAAAPDAAVGLAGVALGGFEGREAVETLVSEALTRASGKLKRELHDLSRLVHRPGFKDGARPPGTVASRHLGNCVFGGGRFD